MIWPLLSVPRQLILKSLERVVVERVEVPDTERAVIVVVVNVPCPIESNLVVAPIISEPPPTTLILPVKVLVPSVEVPETMRLEMVVEASVTVPMFVIRIAEVEPTCKFIMSAVLAERMKFAAM